jgi:hypothetical protein
MGLGRSFFGRTLGAPVAALVVALLAPPPTHNHGAQRASLVSYLAHRCTACSHAPHLHPARTLPAPLCPACAAGPAAAGTLAHVSLEVASCGGVRVPAPAARMSASWVAPGCAARAPPCLLLDI